MTEHMLSLDANSFRLFQSTCCHSQFLCKWVLFVRLQDRFCYMTVDANSFRAHVVTPSFCVSGCCLSDFRTGSVYIICQTSGQVLFI